MVAPLVWGVFALGSRIAATKAGQAATSFVVRKLTGKAAQGLGKPLSSHSTSAAAKAAASKLTDLAGRASTKRKYGTTMLATEMEPLVKEIKSLAPLLGKEIKNFKAKKRPNIRPTSKSRMYKGGMKKSNRTQKRKK